jgi:hypothetical protein
VPRIGGECSQTLFQIWKIQRSELYFENSIFSFLMLVDQAFYGMSLVKIEIMVEPNISFKCEYLQLSSPSCT